KKSRWRQPPQLFYTLSSNVLLPNVGRALKLKPDKLPEVVFLCLSCPEGYFRRKAAVKARPGWWGFPDRLLVKILCSAWTTGRLQDPAISRKASFCSRQRTACKPKGDRKAPANFY